MSWWDYGLKGRDNEVLMKSGSVSQPTPGFDNLNGYIPCGSIVLHESTDAYSQLLLTTGQGTQIYIDLRATRETPQLYFPTESGVTFKYTNTIRLQKGGTSLTFTGGSPIGNTVLGGYASIYDAMYRTVGASGLFDGQRIRSIFHAYPRSKASGGSTQQIGMISSSAGLDFYIVGFSCVTTGGTAFSCPASFIGRIPASALNNLFWFDPDADALSSSEYSQMQGNGDTPDRPVDYDYAGTDIDFPSLPGGASVLGFGAMSIFHPTSAQLASALDIIWSMVDLSSLTDLFDTVRDVIVKLIYKPEQYCVSLMLMPLNISGTSKKIMFGKYDTGVTAPAIADQWQIVDCGSLTVPLKSGSSFDFSPYVKTMIFLPYVGFRSINANEIMGGTIYIKYYVDMFTGSALCFVKISNSNSNTSVLYTYECNVAQQVPITASIYGNLIGTLIQASTAIVTGNAAAAVSAAGSAINNMSPDVQVSGQLNANTGALGNEKPFVAIHFPVQSVPSGFVNQHGYPSNVNIMLGNISGYTEVEKVHLNIPGAYQEDLIEIERLLHDGVIL